MRRLTRVLVVVLVTGVVAVTAALISLTIFLNGQGLRTRVETTLSHALRRPVSLGGLELSLWTGSALATDFRIGDDARFGPEPFVTAARVRLGIEVLPLLLRRQVRIDSFLLESPSIRLVRDAFGRWNYASFRRELRQTSSSGGADRKLPDLAVSRIALENGSVLVRIVSPVDGAESVRDRRFDGVDLNLSDIDLGSTSPFRLSAALPAGGTIAVSGTAGPWNAQRAEATPLSVHVEAHQLDLEAAGLVNASAGVGGLLDRVTLNLAWNGEGFRVSGLSVQSSKLTLGEANRAAGPGAELPRKPSVWSELARHLSIDGAEVRIGTVTWLRKDGHSAIYHQVTIHLGPWSGGAWSEFAASAMLGGGAGIHASGRFRMPQTQPAEPAPAAAVDAQVAVHHLDLAASDLLAPGSALHALVEANAQVRFAAGVLHAEGTARLDQLKLARAGQPSPRPVLVSFALTQSEASGMTSGILERSAFSLGDAFVHVDGAYRLGAPAAQLNLHAQGSGLPIDQIEAFLPMLGMQLPEGSRLTGGTLSTSLAVSGPTTNLTISGPVRVEGTRLLGFDLGSKLSSLARFTGGRIGAQSSPGTAIRSLSLDLRTGGGQIVTDQIVADIGGIGIATGAGSIGQGATLQYSLSFKLDKLISGPDGGAGLARDLASQLPGAWAQRALGAISYLAKGPMKNGIPILIGGTAHHPTVTPNLGALPADRPR